MKDKQDLMFSPVYPEDEIGVQVDREAGAAYRFFVTFDDRSVA